MNNGTRELLEQHFDTAFAAPDGIKKLRELILTLAMQGKLVPQDPNDPPASQLLKNIDAEKKRLVKEGKIKASKPVPEINPAEVPYELPEGWKWVRLGVTGNIFNGNSINASEKDANYRGVEGMPYIATKDVGYGVEPLDYENGVFIPENQKQFRTARKGAVLICAEGGSAGKKCGITEFDICFGNKLFANELFGAIPSRFILYVYLSPVFKTAFDAAMTGIIGGVSIAKFVELPIPLPPLNQQHRIVAKIDQLMARCDELERLRAEREQKRRSVHTAALKQLLDAQAADSIADAWRFVSQNFGDLYAVKENVAELRKAVLQLAVMGKLIPQNPNDPPASQLLKEIEAEKRRLAKEGKIKKPKPLPPIKPEEEPYQLPQGWEWVRLNELGYVMGGGTPNKSNPIFWDGRTPWVSPKDMKVDYILDSQDHVSEQAIRKSSVKLIPVNSLLMVVRGMILAHSFPTALTKVNVTVNQDMKALIPYVQSIQDYLLIYTKGLRQHFLNLVERSTHGTCRLDSEKLFSSLVGLPPLPEQHRIVAKIDQLIALCDTLEQQIDAATSKQTELLDALMAPV